MCWKRADRRTTALAEKTGSAPWSITRRLTLFYTLSTLALLTLVSLALYQLLVKDLKYEESKLIAGKIHDIRMILQTHADDPKFLEEEIQAEGLTSPTSQYRTHYSRVLDETGRVEIEAPGMARLLRGAPFPAPGASAETSSAGNVWHSPEGRTYRLIAAWADPDRPGRLIQIAMDTSKQRRLLAKYRQRLSIALPLGILLSGLIGWMITRQGLLPLRQMAATVQRITINQLHERIDPGRWPEELLMLVRSFNQMLARLEDTFVRLSQFSADLAHELRTPISNLMGETEVALARSREPEEYRQILESSLEEYGRLARMIDSLLFLARAEGAQLPLQWDQFEGRTELDRIHDFFEVMAEEQGVTLTCQGQAMLAADRILLRRAVSNLVANALRYTSRGGNILLAIAQTDEKWADISVSDSGCGIDPEHLPKLCDRFYRVDHARAHHDEGTGLGLAIVKSIMELHQGAMDIHSQPGHGTTVILHFPTVSPASSAAS
ncbi:MAG TPA: heavy metal sensor histidine kinase [Candidatus Competibacteraceae bacterium]|nr:heavy metal sensor histidine kinase [Candidatus Competibacteraceae bacterium]